MATTIIDKICLALAIVAIGSWVITLNPLFAILLAVVADAIAYVPTFAKIIELRAPKHIPTGRR